MAIALEAYARQAKNYEAEDRCKEIRFRAERKWGKLYKDSDKAKGGNPNLSPDTTGSPPTLTELGVTRDQSAKWQKLGEVPKRNSRPL
jgi:hypothetical protein